MPVYSDFTVTRHEDATLRVSMAPPTAIGAWSLRFFAQHRFGGISGLIKKTCASGYGGGASGITIINSGQGVFDIALTSTDTSGLDPGCHAYTVERLDSGSRSVITLGYLITTPSTIP